MIEKRMVLDADDWDLIYSTKVTKHLAGQHDQSTHGDWADGSDGNSNGPSVNELKSFFESDDPDYEAMVAGFGKVYNLRHTGTCADGKMRTLRATVESVDVLEENALEVTGTIENLVSSGTPEAVGEFKRTITMNPDGSFTANHDLFRFWDSDVDASGFSQFGGSGFGDKFYTQSENYYKAHNFKEINLDTAWAGGYIWAKKGFDWNPKIKPNNLIKRLNDLKDLKNPNTAYSADDLSEAFSLLDRFRTNDPKNYPLPYEVAMVGYHNAYDNFWLGKALLLNTPVFYTKTLNP